MTKSIFTAAAAALLVLCPVESNAQQPSCQGGSDDAHKACQYIENGIVTSYPSQWCSGLTPQKFHGSNCGPAEDPDAGECAPVGDTTESINGKPPKVNCCFCKLKPPLEAWDPEAPCPAGKRDGSQICGDTHIRTLGGLWYDFQAVGEFILLTNDESFMAQVRQEQLMPQNAEDPRNFVSVATAIAMTVGPHRVAFYLHETPHLRIDGVPVEASFVDLDPGKVYSERDHARVLFQDASSLDIVFHPDWIDVSISYGCGGSMEGVWAGLLGYGAGDIARELRTRDGRFINTVNPSWEELYGEFGESYRIQQAESLFDYEPGKDTEWYTDRDFPPRTFYASDLNPAQHATAENVCRTAGVTDPILLDACILDVAALGTDEAAKVYVGMTPPGAQAQAHGRPSAPPAGCACKPLGGTAGLAGLVLGGIALLGGGLFALRRRQHRNSLRNTTR